MKCVFWIINFCNQAEVVAEIDHACVLLNKSDSVSGWGRDLFQNVLWYICWLRVFEEQYTKIIK